MSRKLNLMWWVRGGLLEETIAKPWSSEFNSELEHLSLPLQGPWGPLSTFSLLPKSETMSDSTCVIWGWHNCPSVTPTCIASLQQMTSPDFLVTQPHTHPTTQLPLFPPPSSPQQRRKITFLSENHLKPPVNMTFSISPAQISFLPFPQPLVPALHTSPPPWQWVYNFPLSYPCYHHPAPPPLASRSILN